jgi:hypothetical protein
MHRTSPPASPNTKTDPTTYKLNGIDLERTVFFASYRTVLPAREGG